MPTRLSFQGYLTHLADESATFADALTGVPDDRPVPTCPEWSALDLAHHLTQVQSFWSAVVRGPLLTTEQVEQVDAPPHEATLAAQVAALRAAAASLHAGLAATAPETPAWTWATEQTIGFIARRQALEVLVHSLDAQLTAGRRTPMDPALAADGVDEALRVMFAGCPPWGRITPTGLRPVRFTCLDTGHCWDVYPARFTGTDTDGVSHDDPDIVVAQADPHVGSAGEGTGISEDLLCWLWGRPTTGPVTQSGDPATLTAVAQALAHPIT